MSPVNILVTYGLEQEDRERIREVSPEVHLLVAREPQERLRLAGQAEVWFGWGLSREMLAGARRLRWIQTTSAGVDRLLFDELRRSPILVTNASGVYSVPIAEQVLGMMLALARGLHVCVREQSQDRWPGPALRGKMDVLEGGTCVILGLGDIGTEVARRAKAFDMKVLGIRRRPTEKPPFVDELLGPDRMAEALARADYLVVALPLTPVTRHIIDAQALSVMKPSAYVFNVGRGALIDEGALIEALREGRLAGAGLDVFETEPLPEDSPLYRLDNVIITPHSAGGGPRNREKLLDLFCRNLRRYLAGEPLLNVVDKEAGY